MSFLTKAANNTKKKFGRVVSKTVSAGENLVIGKPPCRSSEGSKGSHSKSPIRGKGRKNRGAADEEITDEVHMFCNSMYTHENVLDAVQKVESNTCVSRLELEDLVQRNEAEITEAIVDMLADNFYNSSGDTSGSERIWTSIIFIDCISDHDSYKSYLNLKKEFMTEIKQQLKMKGMTKELPIKFEAKIELHTTLDAYGVIQLLEAVKRDNSVKSVKFSSGFHGDNNEIAEAFSQLVNPTSMEWKESVTIFVKYRRHSHRPKNDGSHNSANAVVAECVKALVTAIFSASMAGSSAFDVEPENPVVGSFEGDESATKVSLFDSFESEHRSLCVRSVSP